MKTATQHAALYLCMLAGMALLNASAQASDWEFRGIPLNQGTRLDSPAFDRVDVPYWTDLSDDFNRDGGLGLSEVSGDQVGFIPPPSDEPIPPGPLTGDAAEAHGRWMPEDGDYVTSAENGGRVHRATNEGFEVACLPWHVISGLGDRYLIEMDAMVAVGESITLGYFGDITQTGSDQGLNGDLGVLILELERGVADNADQITWAVEWDVQGNRQRLSSTTTAAVDDQLRLQLAWEDLLGSGNDLFDAWLETSNGNRRLAQGTMGTEIDVFGAGFEIEGIESYITGFAAAVPEPASGRAACSLLAIGLLGLIRRRQG